MKAVINGYGAYLPAKVVTNVELSETVNTSDAWIRTRTGIGMRHLALKQSSVEMAYLASLAALETSAISKEDIDLIIVATTTADNTFPSTAVKLQNLLGIKKGAAFDIQAVCAGFVYGLNIVDNFIKAGNAQNVLLVGVDKMSSIVDWQDRSTCVLFGDGAGAVIFSATKDTQSGIIASSIHADGTYHDILYTDGGVASNGVAGVIKMDGAEVFKHAVDKMSSSLSELLKKENFTSQDLDFFIPHQANMRILEAVAKRLGVGKEKIISTVHMHANTSAASIPLALSHAISTGLITKGNLLGFCAIGAGLCWGSSLIRY
jgi:3-oxoacyl-[acyl-carrier-protein] synthase III